MTDSALAQGPGVRALRLAWWCAVVPAGMGLAAVGGWLASGGLIAEVIWFYALGMLAIFLGLALMPVGLGAAWWAWQRGAPGRSVLWGCGLLLANLPLAAICLATADWVTDLHVVKVVNRSAGTVGPIRVWIETPRSPRDVLEITALRPGESRTWALNYGAEGTATFRAQDGVHVLEAKPEEQRLLGFGVPTEAHLEFLGNGEYRMRQEDASRWWWMRALLSQSFPGG